MLYRADLRNERGIALVVVLLVVLAISAIAAGAAVLGSNTTLINKYHQRLSVLETAADAALEEARSAVNGNGALYPASGYNTLENGVAVYAADGSVIPNIKRWTYVGPTGITTGQYGVFGSVVVVVEDGQGNRLVRRGEIVQESFAKYAYFTDVEGAIMFSTSDRIYGPVFSNDVINLQSASPGAGTTFFGPVGTARTITNKSAGNYQGGAPRENQPRIAFPNTAQLSALQAHALAGGTAIMSTTAGAAGQATTRIEFVAVDLNADGALTGPDEGFMKVYQVNSTANAWWVVADTISYSADGGVRRSWNCGHVLNTGLPVETRHAYFKTFRHHTGGTNTQDQQAWAYQPGRGTQRRCYLGGSDMLNDSILGSPLHNVFQANDSLGRWLLWPGAVDPRVSSARDTIGDAAYLWPISRTLNPNFKGVIHVTGKVAISGTLRGHITLAATGNIIIADDIRYVSTPGVIPPACDAKERDILGLFSGDSVVVADNLINDPFPPVSGGSRFTWDDDPHENIDAVVLALDNFTVENYDRPSSNFLHESCGTTNWARGCLNLTGGIIQRTRGPVGVSGGRGNLKRYQYDNCAGTNPPPYFPTTGWFVRGHYYEVEPTGFDIATYWPLLVPKP